MDVAVIGCELVTVPLLVLASSLTLGVPLNVTCTAPFDVLMSFRLPATSRPEKLTDPFDVSSDLTPLLVSEASRVQLPLQHTPLATCLRWTPKFGQVAKRESRF